MSKVFNRKAWEILNEDEKMALNLHHLHQKSTWEAGELMGKSHYKYLEIKARAEFFLKLFQEHFDVYGDEVIPEWVNGNVEVREYFNLTLQGRKKVKEANIILNAKFGYSGKKTRMEMITKQMESWAESQNAYNLTLYHLIKDFDRWNNFRILPNEIQEPSAFTRRNKNTQKKHIKYTCTMPDISVLFLQDLYSPKTKSNKGLVYFPFVTLSGEITVLALKEKSLKDITPLQLYLFDDYQVAREYIELVADYALKKERDCKEGLEFWPKYREIIKKARNYAEIQHIVPTRKYLELAMKDLTYI